MTKKLSGRVALILICVGAMVVLFLGWMTFVGPERSKASDLGGKVSDTQTQVSDAQQLLAGSTGKKSLAALHQLQVVMPAQEKMSGDPPAAHEHRQDDPGRARRAHACRLRPPASPRAKNQVPMTVMATGHYFGVQRFLRLLRASADVHKGRLVGNGRLYTVDSIQFSGAPKGGVVSCNHDDQRLHLHGSARR